jgi:hypothetical protein
MHTFTPTARVLTFTLLLVQTAAAQAPTPPEILTDKDAYVLCLVPDLSDAATSWVTLGDGQKFTGVSTKCSFEANSVRSVTTGKVIDFTKRLDRREGGYESTLVGTNKDVAVFELVLTVHTPDKTNAVDLSNIRLTDDAGKRYRPIGLELVIDSSPGAKPRDEFAVWENGRAVYQSNEVERQYYQNGKLVAPSGMIVLLGGSSRPVPVRLLFKVPASEKRFVLQSITQNP